MASVTLDELRTRPTASPNDAAAAIGGTVSARSLRRMAERGELKGVKVGSRWILNTADLLRVFGLAE